MSPLLEFGRARDSRLLGNYWDAVVHRTRRPSLPAGTELEMLGNLIEEVHASNQIHNEAPLASDPVLIRLLARHTEMNEMTPTVMLLPAQPASLPNQKTRHRITQFASLAAAALILLTIAGGFVSLGRAPFGEHKSAVVPAAQTAGSTAVAIASPGNTASIEVALSTDSTLAVTGACYAAVLQPELGHIELLDAHGCDADDGANDGVTTVNGIPAEQPVVVYMNKKPKGMVRLPPTRTVIVEAGTISHIFYATGIQCFGPTVMAVCANLTVNEGSLAEAVGSVCFALFQSDLNAPGQFLSIACDPATPDGPRAGVTQLGGIPAGSYWVVRIGDGGATIGTPVNVTIANSERIDINWRDE